MNIRDINFTKIKKDESGVSLLELLVAVSIFIVVVVTSTQIFNTSLKAGNKVIASQKMQKEMRYVFEVISKEMRVAQVDKAGLCINRDRLYRLSDENQKIEFLNKNGECVSYSLNKEGRFLINREGAVKELTSEEVILENLEFVKTGQVPGRQPFVTVKVRVYPQDIPGQVTVMQTSVSARDYE